jgi:hypothetical protein
MPAMVSGEHKHVALAFVNCVEEAVIPDPIAPCLRNFIPQFLDILTEIGIGPQLGIDVRVEFSPDAGLLSAEVLREVLPELSGLKDPEISQ